jgi:hypothetical protein
VLIDFRPGSSWCRQNDDARSRRDPRTTTGLAYDGRHDRGPEVMGIVLTCFTKVGGPLTKVITISNGMLKSDGPSASWAKVMPSVCVSITSDSSAN